MTHHKTVCQRLTTQVCWMQANVKGGMAHSGAAHAMRRFSVRVIDINSILPNRVLSHHPIAGCQQWENASILAAFVQRNYIASPWRKEL
jgi:hypothetical protein